MGGNGRGDRRKKNDIIEMAAIFWTLSKTALLKRSEGTRVENSMAAVFD